MDQKKGKSSSVGLGTDATYVEVSSSSYGMGKVLVVQRTVWILRVRRICTMLYENGESTNTVPNKPLFMLLRVLLACRAAVGRACSV